MIIFLAILVRIIQLKMFRSNLNLQQGNDDLITGKNRFIRIPFKKMHSIHNNFEKKYRCFQQAQLTASWFLQ